MLTAQSDDFADRLRLLRGHGMRPRYHHSSIGINSRLDSFQAAVLNVKFPLLDHWTFLRRTNADRYTELFTAAGLDRHLGLPSAQPGMRHVWNQYVVRVPGGLRAPLREALSAAKIGTGNLLSAGPAPAAVLPLSGLQARRPARDRAGGGRGARPAHLPRASRRRAAVRRRAASPPCCASERRLHAIKPPKFLTRRAGARRWRSHRGCQASRVQARIATRQAKERSSANRAAHAFVTRAMRSSVSSTWSVSSMPIVMASTRSPPSTNFERGVFLRGLDELAGAKDLHCSSSCCG